MRIARGAAHHRFHRETQKKSHRAIIGFQKIMKSNKRQKESSSEIAIREKLPLELVATTALYFLGNLGEHALPSYEDKHLAVDAAITFLKLCAERIESDQQSDAWHSERLKELESLGWKADDTIPYNEGIKFITRQTRLDRAQEHYEAYRKNSCLLQKPLTASELNAALKEDEEKGFAARWLHSERSLFESSRGSDRLDLRRRKKLQRKA